MASTVKCAMPGSHGAGHKGTGGNVLFSNINFPSLHSGNHHDTSPQDRGYNCIAWAAGRDDAWWDPTRSVDPTRKFYWPPNAPRDYKLTSLIMAYESVG